MGIEGSKQCVHVLAGIDTGRVEIPVDIQPRRIDFAPAQLKQRSNERAGRRHIEHRPLRRRRHGRHQRFMGLRQLRDAEVRRVQAIDLGVVEAFQQLRHIAVIRPRGAIVTMHVKIHDHPIDIHALMAFGGQHRWKRRAQWLQRCLDRLADCIIRRRGINFVVCRRYRHNRRSLRDRCTADQKAHKKHAAYDE
ncbi:hypothetical protein D3C84_677610 [compost metagenome]